MQQNFPKNLVNLANGPELISRCTSSALSMCLAKYRRVFSLTSGFSWSMLFTDLTKVPMSKPDLALNECHTTDGK
ncbi:hypothetical protein BpHYR1_047098 [Brachionus plicatilis]|uniref:Uncharacterized protein n=1 Tax=Brachionus plicatilis TaxID=10195 RepID=A0A3M7Q201_BRAPC|nr:hypothetical protein BpHYR1_047098 [Brachionus plicatilis]